MRNWMTTMNVCCTGGRKKRLCPILRCCTYHEEQIKLYRKVVSAISFLTKILTKYTINSELHSAVIIQFYIFYHNN